MKCEICPRNCQIDRTFQKGFCQNSNTLKIAKIIKNFEWEEPCIVGEKNTLAIFFSGCNLRCDYCQNYEISHNNSGREFTEKEFINLIEKEQENHSSIDLITPTHFSDTLSKIFKKIDKKIPVVWNTNGYETPQNIEKVSEFVDVFLTDFKYCDDKLAKELSKVEEYSKNAIDAIETMCKLKPDIEEDGFLKQGVVIRHLVLPYHVKNSLDVLDKIKEKFPNRIVSIMSQFTPNGHGKLDRKLLPIEYKTVLNHAEKLGINKGYFQDFSSASENYVPDF